MGLKDTTSIQRTPAGYIIVDDPPAAVDQAAQETMSKEELLLLTANSLGQAVSVCAASKKQRAPSSLKSVVKTEK